MKTYSLVIAAVASVSCMVNAHADPEARNTVIRKPPTQVESQTKATTPTAQEKKVIANRDPEPEEHKEPTKPEKL